MPVENRSRFTSGFGKRDIDNGPRDHWGVDFGGPTPGQSVLVKAAADGVVEWIKGIPLRSGPAIGIKHPDGTLTAYLHTRHHKVRVGQQVKRGDAIAETWHTGIPLSNGIHLHFEWWDDYRNHRSVFNPLDRLAQYGWVIKDGRMHDEWGGRATATPTTITPAATPRKEWSDMATKDEIKAAFREVLAEHKTGIDLTATTAWRVKDGKQEATTASRVLQEVHGLAYEAARAAGATEQALREVLDRPRENENKEN